MNNMTAQELKEEFVRRGRTLGSIESFTGGLFAREMTKIPGASKFFKGAIVTYATEEKIRIVGVNENTIKQFGVVSQECAGEMCGHGKFLLNVDYCISFTGNAGPDAMEGKPVGEIYIGVCAYDLARVQRFQLSGTRDEIQNQAVSIGIAMLEAMLKEKN